jgi:ADP-dependent NAD(P)H-hydrate dehydratase / NAD(P)H-hydrate epimerase
MKILTASQMREVDRLTTERYGIPSLLLMENAGSGVVRAMESHFPDMARLKAAVCCGKGNNGGDGFVVARHLMLRRMRPAVLLFASPEEVRGDAAVNLSILQKMGASIQVLAERDSSEERIQRLFRDLEVDLVVDALLGTGARLPVTGFMSAIIQQIRRFPRIVAIDIPSGLNCDAIATTEDLIAPRAEFTVTFTAPKPAHLFASRDSAIARWVLVPIGSPAELVEDPSHWLNYLTEDEAAAVLGRFNRREDSHKGDYGHVLVVAGSTGKTGAACLTAGAALLAGAGLVTLATPAPCLPVAAAQMLEVMTEPLEATDSGGVSTKAFDYSRVEMLLDKKDVLAVGPGLGGHAETGEFVRRLVEQTALPLVLDADGLNAFVGQTERLKGQNRILILTPHPGEFARLLERPTAEVQAERVALARDFAQQHRLHLVLKGHRTIYASPSGQVFVNSTGNPGMATGGSGDVLAGILAGLLSQAHGSLPSSETVRMPSGSGAAEGAAQLKRLEEVIALGVYLHGLAGDRAAETKGEMSLVASDILAHLPAACLQLESANCAKR